MTFFKHPGSTGSSGQSSFLKLKSKSFKMRSFNNSIITVKVNFLNMYFLNLLLHAAPLNKVVKQGLSWPSSLSQPSRGHRVCSCTSTGWGSADREPLLVFGQVSWRPGCEASLTAGAGCELAERGATETTVAGMNPARPRGSSCWKTPNRWPSKGARQQRNEGNARIKHVSDSRKQVQRSVLNLWKKAKQWILRW